MSRYFAAGVGVGVAPAAPGAVRAAPGAVGAALGGAVAAPGGPGFVAGGPGAAAGAAAPAGAAGHRLFDRLTSGYHPSGSITTVFTFLGPGMSAV